MFDPEDPTPQLESLEVGAVTVVAHFLELLDFKAILDRHLPPNRLGRRSEVPHGKVLSVMVTNILLSRSPLYAVPEWLGGFVPEHFGIDASQRAFFNDDRIGRSLDHAFLCNLASLTTDVVVRAVRRFALDLRQLHNDSTSVTMHGEYRGQDEVKDKEPPWITFGFNKDHRPDLKQLVFELSVTADGAVPIHFRIHDGNVTDDQTHADTWSALRDLHGNSDFLYVADSKLCVSDTMRMIAREQGTFLTVMPRTRAEDKWFKEYLRDHLVDWKEVRREKNPRDKNGSEIVYRACESPQLSKEGFRIFWYRSSQKREDDSNRRFKKMNAARSRIDALAARDGRHRFRSLEAAREDVDKVLVEMKVKRFLKVRIVEHRFEEFVQQGPGRPGPDTRYRREEIPRFVFEVEDDGQALREEADNDGLFPLITNSKTFTPAEALDKYKYQPYLEKRHEQMKSVLDVAPVFLKKPERVAALLLLYFLALLIFSLIERTVRREMKRKSITSLPLYPEERRCRAPTADLVLGAFAGVRRHHLLGPDRKLLRVFHDPLADHARTLLELLTVDPKPYGIET